MSDSTYLHMWVVYRTPPDTTEEHPAGLVVAKDEAQACDQIAVRFPRRSKLTLLGGSQKTDGTFRAVSAYLAPLADVERMAALVATDLAFINTTSLANSAAALAQVAALVQAAQAQAFGKKH